jgi:predicted RNase H-like HicB family nuclease
MTNQQEDATYDAYLLSYPDGSWLALAADLPGAYATGATADEATARLAAAIPAYYAWLQSHDDYTPIIHDSPQVVVRERAQADARGGAFFAADVEPVTEEDLDWWLAVIGWAYDDLEAAAQRATQPNQRALIGAVAAMQRDTVARATGGFTGQLGDGSSDPLASLKLAHQATLAVFRRTRPEQRAATREVDGQRWSLRRGLRESALLARRAWDDLNRS